jgi:hypothetical protein
VLAVADNTINRIKELAKQCNIQELDGYMVNIWNDQDGLMRISADQFDQFCHLVANEINNIATPGSSDVGIQIDA